MSDEKPKIRDQIDALMVNGDSLTHEDLVDKINDLFGQNSHKAYDSFYATMKKDPNVGVVLIFEGEREESKEETVVREATESSAKKRLEDAELKEYLRLNKKYGKKNS